MRLSPALAAVLLAVAACGDDGRGAKVAASSQRMVPSRVVASPTATVRAAPGEPSGWTIPEVARRLSDAGLVVADSGQSATRAPIAASGTLLHVSGGSLEVYLYADAAARERASAQIDTATRGLPSIYNPRFIFSGNLIAVLTTPSDRTAERVASVLEAWHTR